MRGKKKYSVGRKRAWATYRLLGAMGNLDRMKENTASTKPGITLSHDLDKAKEAIAIVLANILLNPDYKLWSE